jgi:hypothetical protein
MKMKKFALVAGLAATATLVALAPVAAAGGSGDGSTSNEYKQPAVPAASEGTTATQTSVIVYETAATTMATPSASPILKAAGGS